MQALLLHHGMDEYDGCLDLHDMLQWNQESEKIRPWVPNYTLQVVNLKDMQEEKFQTGLRELIGVMLHCEDLNRYRNEEGEMEMCKALEDLRREGYEEGLSDGRSQGLSQGLSQGIQALVENLQECGLEHISVCARVAKAFSLTQADMKYYMEQYWKRS